VNEPVLEELLRQVKGYQQLPINWDTYGGIPASPRAIAFVTDLLQTVAVAGGSLPTRLSPIGTGAFLEWVAGDMHLSFEAEENSVLYSLRKGDHVIEHGEDAAFDVNRATELVARVYWLT